MKESASMAILGGGIAGLTAARALAIQGLSVVLLEARGRLGGRILATENHPSRR